MTSPNPNAAICLTGSELTRGETRDLNGSFLGRGLSELGIHVDEVRLVPDDDALLLAAIRDLVKRADIVILSGGLGPTADDRTIAALAQVLGRGVERDAASAERMKQIAIRRGRPEGDIPENFYKQAEIVEGARVLENARGLAPGTFTETDRGVVAALPGVPRELNTMFEEELVPALLEHFHLDPPRILRAKLLGHPESWAEDRIQSLGIDFTHIDYGISAKPGELTLKFIAREPSHHGEIDSVLEKLRDAFADDLEILPATLSADAAETAVVDVIHRLLIDSGRTVATAESCTGGWIAKRLTDSPGSSAYLIGSVVAYQNRIKRSLLGVDAQALDTHGAVSEVVCRQMAAGAIRAFDSDYALSVTGIAGPGGGTEQKPVGTVWMGLARRTADEPHVETVLHELRGDREMIRRQTLLRALDLLRRELRRASIDGKR